MSLKQRYLAFIACLICAASVFSCSSTDLGIKFTPVDASYMLDMSKSIAVISGHNDDNDIQLTEMIIERLSAKGKFKVLPHSEVKKIVPRYPLNLNVIDFFIANDKEKRYTPYLTSTSKESIDAVQKLVKTDYILVVWIDDLESESVSYIGGRGGSSSTKYMLVMSRLISYPGGNVTGFSSRWNENSSTFNDWKDFFEDVSDDLVKEIIMKTK